MGTYTLRYLEVLRSDAPSPPRRSAAFAHDTRSLGNAFATFRPSSAPFVPPLCKEAARTHFSHGGSGARLASHTTRSGHEGQAWQRSISR